MISHFFCRNCKEIVESEDALSRVTDIHTELDGCPTEVSFVRACPYCGSEDLEEACSCDECGDLYGESELDENWLCPACKEKAAAELEDSEAAR